MTEPSLDIKLPITGLVFTIAYHIRILTSHSSLTQSWGVMAIIRLIMGRAVLACYSIPGSGDAGIQYVYRKNLVSTRAVLDT